MVEVKEKKVLDVSGKTDETLSIYRNAGVIDDRNSLGGGHLPGPSEISSKGKGICQPGELGIVLLATATPLFSTKSQNNND